MRTLILCLLLALCLIVVPALAEADLGGYSIEEWSSKNIRGLVQETDLQRLRDLNLVDARGLQFHPAPLPNGYFELRSWLLGDETSSNMAYKLSIQLAVMDLNVNIKKVDGDTLIYAPGTQSADTLGYATLDDLIAEVNTEVGLHPLTFPGSPYRDYQEALKNALDITNDNKKADLTAFSTTSESLSHGLLTDSPSGKVVGWGEFYNSTNEPAEDEYFVAIAGGTDFSIALRSNPGSVYGWGDNEWNQTTLPAGNYTAIAAGISHTLGLKQDGSIVSLSDSYDDTNAPGGIFDFIAIDAGGDYMGSHNLGLRSDGSVRGWGYNAYGQATSPAGNDFDAVTTGGLHSLALRSNGTLLSWGEDLSNQVEETPKGNNFTAIAAGTYHSLALRDDGSIIGWGWNASGQATNQSPPPMGIDVVAIAAGEEYSLALWSDGTIHGWGANYFGQYPAPENYYTSIAAGYSFGMGLVSPFIVPVAQFSGTPTSGIANLTVQFTDASTGTGPLDYAWDFNNDGVVDSTNPNPSHVYTSSGNYTINLTVTGPGGSDVEIKIDYIKVQSVLPLPGQVNPPTDPDHDGLYEDLSGNGGFSYNDIILFFNNWGWIQNNEPVSAFDFSGNGGIGYVDVITLFHHPTGG